ncbi:MAG: acyl-CoA dehydrogenase family protein [Deltaproteobacteria bacterium]|jgi:acyl-CoA dehydrogenase family protein 9|nr:acyl-CoA dehydrogenase family protein [Deltaproteobacteria bacterium]
MDYENFLTNTYFGRLDPEAFDGFKDFEATETTRDIIQKFLDVNSQYPASQLEEQGMVPADLMEKLGRNNFFGLTIPREYGGVGLSLNQYLHVVETLASQNMSLGILALAHLSIGIKGIVLFGTEDQKRKYLSPAASGDMIFSYALTEPQTGSDAQHIETFATESEDGRHYILDGTKTYITNANYAGGLTVFAQMDAARPGYMGAFIVETGWEGVTIGKDMPKMGLKASSTAAIQFKNVKVPRENLLGGPGDGFKIAMVILNYGRMALGAASAGMMKQSLADMAERAAKRVQFGVPINQFELIQEKMVQAKVNGYVASAITAFTAGMLEANPTALVAMESSHCKLFGTTRAWDAIYDALQVAGGSGYLTTQPYERRMRDFRVATIFEGTTEIHSMYPAMFVLRTLSKRIQAQSSGRVSQLITLIKEMFRRSSWPLNFDDKRMNRALRFAKSNARRIRLMILMGTILFGRSITQKQFFLRRITTLSLYLYGIIAVLAKIEAARKSGRPVAADLDVLAYFLEEARQTGKLNRRLFPTRQEQLHHKIASEIVRSRGQAGVTPEESVGGGRGAEVSQEAN